jgi:uncharacterized protein (DUF1697 family)
MADLRAAAEGLGFTGVRTLLQSGNVVFEAPGLSREAAELALEGALQAHLGAAAEVVVRTPSAWRALIEANPFPEAARSDPARLLMVALKTTPAAGAEAALLAAITGPERARVIGDQAYVFYPAGIAGSRVTQPVIDRLLRVRGTARNWNTVLKLASLVEVLRNPE